MRDLLTDLGINKELIKIGLRKPGDWQLLFTSGGWVCICMLMLLVRQLFPATRFMVTLVLIGTVLYWGITFFQVLLKVFFTNYK